MRQYQHYDSAALVYLFKCERHALRLQRIAMRRAIGALGAGEVADWFTRKEIEAAHISACACLRRMRQLRAESHRRDETLARPLRELTQA